MTIRFLLPVFFFLAPLLFACDCDRFGICNEVGSSNLVFIGTVESIEPLFLSHWNPASSPSLKSLNDAFLAAKDHPSPEALASLKSAYLATFPDASADRKIQLQGAKTAAGVAALFYAGVGRGMRVHFHVETLFKHGEDDGDAPKKDDDSKSPKTANKNDQEKKPEDFFDVWTPFGDCGVSFQAGETYLVYASDDEETSDSIVTDSCTRTRRLSEAGDDLAYLYFYKERPDASTRLEGFATTNQRYRLDFDPRHPERIRPVVAGVIIELQSDGLRRYMESDQNGRFVFDGLPTGDYKLSVYSNGYPRNGRLLAGPQPFHVPAKSCPLQILILPGENGKQDPPY